MGSACKPASPSLLSLQSPAHSYSSYDSSKHEGGERGAEDLSLHRGDEDDEDHEDHDDAEKAAETDGVEAERLKAFNVSPPPPWWLAAHPALPCRLLVNVDTLETCLFNLQRRLLKAQEILFANQTPEWLCFA